jgi:hypothetical protein
LTGRLKEIINRGGEKIAPREIDEVLLSHPDVTQAVTFALPHPTLGESVAAAVVPKDGRQPGESELRKFALGRLPEFKVPTRIVVVTQIPKGPTGKVQRTSLAAKLADELAMTYIPPAGGLEQLCAMTFERVLQRNHIGRNENFFALGGDSVRATQVISRLAKSLAQELPPTILFHSPTPALLAADILQLQNHEEIGLLTEKLHKLSREEVTTLLEQPFGDRV